MEEEDIVFDAIDELDYLSRYLKRMERQKAEYTERLEEDRRSLANLEDVYKKVREKEDTSYHYFSPNEQFYDISEKELEEKKADLIKEKNSLERQIIELNKNIVSFDKIYASLKKSRQLTDKRQTVKVDQWGLNVLKTQEEERKRIARELHDSTVQNLTNFVHKTELCLKLVDIDTIRVKLELQTMIDAIHETINDMRNIIYDLRPMSIDDLGLCLTMERFVNKIRNQYDSIRISFKVVYEEIVLPSIVNLTLFRIMQEACNNAIKYANPSNIDICLTYGLEYVEIEVRDDGTGFDLNKVEHKKSDVNSGFGLSIMRERIYLLSGNIDIRTGIGEGTVIQVQVPYVSDKREEEEK